jgi:hypothetical protein
MEVLSFFLALNGGNARLESPCQFDWLLNSNSRASGDITRTIFPFLNFKNSQPEIASFFLSFFDYFQSFGCKPLNELCCFKEINWEFLIFNFIQVNRG